MMHLVCTEVAVQEVKVYCLVCSEWGYISLHMEKTCPLCGSNRVILGQGATEGIRHFGTIIRLVNAIFMIATRLMVVKDWPSSVQIFCRDCGLRAMQDTINRQPPHPGHTWIIDLQCQQCTTGIICHFLLTILSTVNCSISIYMYVYRWASTVLCKLSVEL